MSSRSVEKQRRKAARLERERQRAAAEQRARRLRTALAALAGVAVVGVLMALALPSGGPSGRRAEREGPFGPHYAGLERRRLAAGVPTMAEGDPAIHVHPLLVLYASGRRTGVPANIGIDPARPPAQMAGLHTHDGSGTLHVEGVRGATLGQFFQVWGVPLSAQRLGPYRADGRRAVRMWVDGRPSRAFGALALRDGQRIVVSYGAARRPPAGT
jgi:hypothetical protein